MKRRRKIENPDGPMILIGFTLATFCVAMTTLFGLIVFKVI